MNAYRFVVVYRSERRADPADEPIWRGWIEQVYPAGDGEESRHWFRDVSELPAIICRSIPELRRRHEGRD